MRPLLQLVKLLALSRSLALEVVKLASLDSQIFLNVALAFLVLVGLLRRKGLLLDLGVKNFIFGLKSIQRLLVLRFESLALLDLGRALAYNLFHGFVERAQIMH